MEYAQKILSSLGQFLGQFKDRRLRTKRFVKSVFCAYCIGSGVDPKYGNMSRCPVCGAMGRVAVMPPVVTCLRCLGAGREGGTLTCLACRGTGVVSVRKEAATCSKCNGTGEDGLFYCITCNGQGIA